MKKFELLAASALVVAFASPASAQVLSNGTTTPGGTVTDRSVPPAATQGPGQTPIQSDDPAAQNTAAEGNIGDIIVTAQRQSQRLQNVPIAVSAFTANDLAKQQINSPIQLQQSLPNVTFTKTNFTTSSFTIRGIGDLCTGATCDSATAIHINDMPLLTTRLFETEFFDLERIEVLRGPQGTLFGRNATSGVVNFITAKPDLDAVHAAGEFEYGNYDSKRVKGMFNLPITHTIGLRVAGTYLNRDGFTKNLFDNSRIDGRDLYAVRGTLSWVPDANTRLDLMAYYFHERDDRSRIQKQLCHRDPTGILGCLPDRLANETPNGNSTLASVLTSSQFFSLAASPALARFGTNSLYGTDTYSGVANPSDVRTVNVDYDPTYFADEEIYQAKFFHDFGSISLNLTGGYTRDAVDSRTDYNLAVENSYANNPGLLALNALGRAGSPFAFLNGVRQTLIPNGPASLCQSDADPNGVGVYGGNSVGCAPTSLDFDRSREHDRQYSIEGHIDSQFDGPFNFLLGGIYVNHTAQNVDYFVNAFGLDYASGILGAASSAAIPGVNGNAFLATPFYRNDGDYYRLKSYGIFGETYFDFTSKLKLTLGLRYNNDKKFVRARNLTLNVLTPIGSTSILQGLNYAQVDFDPSTAGIQPYAEVNAKFDKLTGRAVLDYQITRDNLLYASFSRGYKSGGINPPLPPQFAVATTFLPEQIDAYEIGSKNTFGNGRLRLNLTGFYYKYKNLQLSRIIARTSVNDNVNADIYGVEAEAVVSPIPAFVMNANFSYLHSKVAGDDFLSDPRDPSGGRTDAVIIKDITNASNCAVYSNVGSAAATQGYVNAINGGINAAIAAGGSTLLPAQQVLSNGTFGAFSVCSQLQANAPTVGAAFGGISYAGSGVATNISGNKLPQAPTYKVAVGAQYTAEVGSSGYTVVPRVDLNYTGNFYASIFNNIVDRIPGYEVVNAQIQINAPDDRFYIRGFVKNLTNNDAITGQYVTDQSSGLFTNIFTIEPRQYGIAAGFKF